MHKYLFCDCSQFFKPAGLLPLKKQQIQILEGRLSVIKSKALGYYVHFGVSCDQCLYKNMRTRSYCVQCCKNYCQLCFSQTLASLKCSEHNLIVFKRPLNRAEQLLLKDRQLQSFFSLPYSESFTCKLCNTVFDSNALRFMAIGRSRKLLCHFCIQRQRVGCGLVAPSKKLNYVDLQLLPEGELSAVVRLVCECHQGGVCGLQLHQNNLLRRGGGLFIKQNSAEYSKCADQIETDKTDVYRIGQMLRRRPEPLCQYLSGLCMAPESEARPNSMELAALLIELQSEFSSNRF